MDRQQIEEAIEGEESVERLWMVAALSAAVVMAVVLSLSASGFVEGFVRLVFALPFAVVMATAVNKTVSHSHKAIEYQIKLALYDLKNQPQASSYDDCQ